MVNGMRTFAYAWLLCGAAFLCGRASAEPMDRQNYEQLWSATFSYYAAARVCGDRTTIEQAKNSFRRAMNYGEFHGILSKEAKQFLTDPNYYISQGEEMYAKQKWVSCDQVRYYIDQLDNQDEAYEPYMLAFCWPSDGKVQPPWKYASDREDAALSGVAMARALRRFVDFLNDGELCRQRLHLVAHRVSNFASVNLNSLIGSSGLLSTSYQITAFD